MHRRAIAVTFVIFDLLSLDGRSLLKLPYTKRCAEVEGLHLSGHYWMTPEAFDDGAALFEAVCEHELEGVVAKRLSGSYRPSDRGWVKVHYWRYEMKREAAIDVSPAVSAYSSKALDAATAIARAFELRNDCRPQRSFHG